MQVERRSGIVYSKPERSFPATEGGPASWASIVIRTYNEGRHLREVLTAIAAQLLPDGRKLEVLVVDSGSTDSTLDIAATAGARVLHITPAQFSFGGSLNLGSEAARGEFIVYISGHCIPVGEDWLSCLLEGFADPTAMIAYGRQMPGATTRYSEAQIFRKYFPASRPASQAPDFCNNANAAIRRSAWRRFRFDESLTGLEDIEMGQRVVAAGFRVAYVPEAKIVHLHDETWSQVRHRFEREAIALRVIRPELHLRAIDTVCFLLAAVRSDSREALREGKWFREIASIAAYRFHQYFGSWSGNQVHRRLSHEEKLRYFYPR